ncbi:MAG: response regulator [Pseudomonadota bacterium]
MTKTTRTKKKMTKKAPGSELAGLRGRVAELEKSQAGLRKLQKELRDSEKNWRQLVENIPDVVMTVDRGGTIRAINHTVSGLTVKDVIGKKLYGYIAPEQRDMMREHLEQAFIEGIPFSFEILGTGERGPGTAWYETRILPIQSGRNVEAVILISKDVTERRKKEEERRQLSDQLMHAQKLESLGVMAGGIAHDFNNLLTGILGSAGLALLDTPGDSPARESIEEIEKAAMRAAELCKQMLAYSGKGKFDVKPIDLSSAVKDMGHFLDASISKKITLRCNLSQDLPPVEADTAQVQQIIMNLVTNAADAIGEGIGVVHVKTGCMDCDEAFLSASAINENLRPGTYAFLQVRDTGCGLDSETEGKLFDPFFTTKFTGRGLGLAAVAGIVRGHGGALRVQSTPGRGSTFTVLFPISAKPVRQKREREPSGLLCGRGTVLLVDDEEEVRVTAGRMLERMGFTVLTASDGREAIDLFRAGSHEILFVLLDMTMPHMSGDETFRELRRLRSEVRVILSSGYSEQDAVSRFRSDGLAGFIQKPYRFKDLREKIKSVI